MVTVGKAPCFAYNKNGMLSWTTTYFQHKCNRFIAPCLEDVGNGLSHELNVTRHRGASLAGSDTKLLLLPLHPPRYRVRTTEQH